MRGIILIAVICLMGFKSPITTNSKGLLVVNGELKINDTVTRILVSKKHRKLYAFFGDTFKVYRCAFGANPEGHKQKEGDNRTPEGNYFIEYRNPRSRGYRSLKISYPNAADRAKAKEMGVSPGGDIMVHGLWWPSQDPETQWMYDWTWGCIALNNKQILELYNWTFVNTPITIRP